jgi:hypothetical protein
LLNCFTFPVSWLLAKTGWAPILHFTAYKLK